MYIVYSKMWQANVTLQEWMTHLFFTNLRTVFQGKHISQLIGHWHILPGGWRWNRRLVISRLKMVCWSGWCKAWRHLDTRWWSVRLLTLLLQISAYLPTYLAGRQFEIVVIACVFLLPSMCRKKTCHLLKHFLYFSLQVVWLYLKYPSSAGCAVELEMKTRHMTRNTHTITIYHSWKSYSKTRNWFMYF